MAIAKPLVTQFSITGKLENIIIKSNNCLKSLQLVTEQAEYQIKIAKELRKNLSIDSKLSPGCWLKVTGMRKNKIHKGTVEYKAYRIEFLSKPVSAERSKFEVTNNPKAKVLFCQKSTCWKSGGKATYQSLKKELENRGIADRIEIKTVGCLKQCKKAPNIVILPDKARYSRVHPQQLSLLIEKHLLEENSDYIP